MINFKVPTTIVCCWNTVKSLPKLLSPKEHKTDVGCSTNLSSLVLKTEELNGVGKKKERENKVKMLVTFHLNLHACGKARDLLGAQVHLHSLRNSRRILQVLMVEGNLLRAWQMGESFSPSSLM